MQKIYQVNQAVNQMTIMKMKKDLNKNTKDNSKSKLKIKIRRILEMVK